MYIKEEFSLSKSQLGEWVTLDSNCHYVITAEEILGQIACFLLYDDFDEPVAYCQYTIQDESNAVIAQGETDEYGYLLSEKLPSGEYILKINDYTCRIETLDNEEDTPHQIRIEGLYAPEIESITDDEIGQELYEDSETEIQS